MKTFILYFFLCFNAVTIAQEQDVLTSEQKDAKTEYLTIINKYKGQDLATLPQSARDSFIIATAKNAIFPRNFQYTMSDIKKDTIREIFSRRYAGEPVYKITFYKDMEKKEARRTVYIFEKSDQVLVEIYEKPGVID